jgi:hypothetical protein
MARAPTHLLTPADQERRRSLRYMNGVELGALLLMAVLDCDVPVPSRGNHDP